MASERKIDMAILGLLSHEPMTGYDIKKQIDNSISFFWKGSFGSIYPALSGMEKDGLISRKEMNETGRPKILYSITNTGLTVLQDWLQNSAARDELKYETLLKIFFGGAAGKESTLCTIETFARNTEKQLAVLKIFRDNLSMVLEQEDHLYFYLTVDFGIETYEGYLRWCEKAKKLLQIKSAGKIQ